MVLGGPVSREDQNLTEAVGTGPLFKDPVAFALTPPDLLQEQVRFLADVKNAAHGDAFSKVTH